MRTIGEGRVGEVARKRFECACTLVRVPRYADERAVLVRLPAELQVRVRTRAERLGDRTPGEVIIGEVVGRALLRVGEDTLVTYSATLRHKARGPLRATTIRRRVRKRGERAAKREYTHHRRHLVDVRSERLARDAAAGNYRMRERVLNA